MSYRESITYWKFIAKKHREYDRETIKEIAKLNNRSFRLQKKIQNKERLGDDFFENTIVSKDVENGVSILKKAIGVTW